MKIAKRTLTMLLAVVMVVALFGGFGERSAVDGEMISHTADPVFAFFLPIIGDRYGLGIEG